MPRPLGAIPEALPAAARRVGIPAARSSGAGHSRAPIPTWPECSTATSSHFTHVFLCHARDRGHNPVPAGPVWFGAARASVVKGVGGETAQEATARSLVQYLHLEAASGTSDWHSGQVFVGGGSPKTDVPRFFMYLRYGTTRAK